MFAKKNLYILSVAMMLLATMVFAQERTIVTIGGTWWNAAYSIETEDGDKVADIGSGNSIGPNISINHGKVNLGASLLFGTFPVESYIGGYDNFENKVDMSRSDLNFTLGYRISRIFNIFVGAKYMKWAMDIDDYTGLAGNDEWGNNYYQHYDNVELSESGMMYGLGVSAVFPIGAEGLYAFGSLAGMGGTLTYKTEIENQGESRSAELGDVSSSLAAINLGIGYRFPSGLGINAGYRADLFSEEVDEDDSWSNSEDNNSIRVQGLIITASYSF